ncbi:hypothetical protein Tco_0967221 [Tanacetum coccineum]
MDAIACLSYLSHQHEITIGSGLKKHFEDGVVKREENLQPNEEVEIARHASRGNWRREKRKNKYDLGQGFKLPAYVMMSIEHMLTHSSNTFMNIYVDGVTLKESGKTAYLFSGGFRQMINAAEKASPCPSSVGLQRLLPHGQLEGLKLDAEQFNPKPKGLKLDAEPFDPKPKGITFGLWVKWL